VNAPAARPASPLTEVIARLSALHPVKIDLSLDRMQRVRRMRELGRSIAELQEMQGAQGVPEALQRALVEDGTVVHEMVGGGPRPLDNGPPGP